MSLDGNASLQEFDSPSFGEQVGAARAEFERQFGRPPQWLSAAPGRVNLIGEHTDYNGGFVFPLAIERYVTIAGAPAKNVDHQQVRVYSQLLQEAVSFQLNRLEPDQQDWSSYVRGVFSEFLQRGLHPGPVDLLIDSRVPLGGGLSSSAALEVATATLLEAAVGRRLDAIEKAKLCQAAEHRFAGVPCGIMDQMSSTLGEAGKLLLIDCRSETVELAPFDDPQVAVLIINSNVRHELTGGEYAERRSQCAAAAEALGVSLLRELSVDQFNEHADRLDPILLRRARHVVTENQRTLDAAAALRTGDWPRVGELMVASHFSLRDDYQVSCEELDALVDLAQNIGPAGGVLGSRMTGGGFGGCTVTLVTGGRERAVADQICSGYERLFQREATPFVTKPARGAHLVQG